MNECNLSLNDLPIHLLTRMAVLVLSKASEKLKNNSRTCLGVKSTPIRQPTPVLLLLKSLALNRTRRITWLTRVPTSKAYQLQKTKHLGTNIVKKMNAKWNEKRTLEATRWILTGLKAKLAPQIKPNKLLIPCSRKNLTTSKN